MAVPAIDQFVYDDPIKPFFGRHCYELLCQRDMLFAGETEAVDNSPRFIFGLFDSLANLDFLLACEQRHLAHLAQIHPHWVIQNIESPSLFLVADLGLLAAIDFGWINNVDFEIPQLGKNLVEIFRRNDVIWQSIIHIVISEMPL